MQEEKPRPSGLERFVTSDTQEGYELLHKAREIFSDENLEVMKVVHHDESTYIVTPYYCPEEDSYRESFGSKELDKQRYAIAAVADSTTHYEYGPSSPLYLIINDVYENPLQFEANADGLLQVNVPGEVIEDELLERIVDCVAKKTSRELDAIQSKEKDVHERRVHRVSKLVGGLVLVGALAGGAFGANQWMQTRNHDKQVAAEQKTAAAKQRVIDFDNNRIVLPGAAIKADSDFVTSDPALFKQFVPKYTGTVGASPREIKVKADGCHVIATQAASIALRVVTDQPNETVQIGRKADGSIQVCQGSTPGHDSHGNLYDAPTYYVAIQTAPTTQ